MGRWRPRPSQRLPAMARLASAFAGRAAPLLRSLSMLTRLPHHAKCFLDCCFGRAGLKGPRLLFFFFLFFKRVSLRHASLRATCCSPSIVMYFRAKQRAALALTLRTQLFCFWCRYSSLRRLVSSTKRTSQPGTADTHTRCTPRRPRRSSRRSISYTTYATQTTRAAPFHFHCMPNRARRRGRWRGRRHAWGRRRPA